MSQMSGPSSPPTLASLQRAGMDQAASTRWQAHSTGHQGCQEGNAGKTDQLNIDDPAEASG
jgi:hypothetical protein